MTGGRISHKKFDHYQVDLRQPWRLAGALWSCALRHGSQEPERDCEIAHPAEPDPFLYGVPRARGQPEAADEILLHGGLDGAQRQGRWSHPSAQRLHYTIVVPADHVAEGLSWTRVPGGGYRRHAWSAARRSVC